MKFLEPSSLPPDFQDAIKFWPKAKDPYTGWLDVSKLPPVPFQHGALDGEHVLAIAHYDEKTRAALRKECPPEALDRFAAELCQQLPDDDAATGVHNHWQLIAVDLGKLETAAAIAKIVGKRFAIRHKGPYSPSGMNFLIHRATGVLSQIGDASSLPAMILCLYRLYRLKHRFLQGWVVDQIAALNRRIAASPADIEDWSVPDAAEPDEIEELSKEQSARLQKAMLTERRWTVAMFDRRVVHQSIVGPLAAGLVWGYFDPYGKLQHAFVLGPDLSYPASPKGATVGIVHPAHLTPAEAAKWRERAAELPAPFEQWKPAVHALSAKELAGDQILRLPTISFPAATLLCRLEAMGWTRPKGGKMLKFHGRLFPEFGMGAVIEYSGIPLTYGTEWAEQKIEACFFAAHCKRIPLSQVSPIAISAVLADLEALGKPREVRKK